MGTPDDRHTHLERLRERLGTEDFMKALARFMSDADVEELADFVGEDA